MNVARIIDEETARKRMSVGESVSCIYDTEESIYYIDCGNVGDIDRFLNATRADYRKYSFLSDGVRSLDDGAKADLPAGRYIVHGGDSFTRLGDMGILENLNLMGW